ncbi:NRPS-like enzyme [Apiospora phragmitis]|uniref:NRPS-like enzyme n=1 Tax=Apiospora phragmitis TaxID=2905665 RepID=A0ABR1TTY4_9PEZI
MPILDITKDLSALFRQQAAATPDALALEDETTKWTYAELERETSVLADRLRHLGVGRDNLVGVLLGRSADYIIACLAALRAGGAFLVLELAYPPGLLADVIDDASPAVVVTHRAYAGSIKPEIPLILLDEAKAHTNGAPEPEGQAKELPPLPSDDDLDRLAFVCYTSGTTGRPKGIANPHRASVQSYDQRFHLSDLQPGGPRRVQFVAVPDETSYDPEALVDLLASQKITETLMTPTLLATVLSRHSKLGARLPDLRRLWLNGEVVTADLAKRALNALPNTRLLNCYSASETHEIACGDIKEMLTDESTICPVGPPMDPKHTYILDENFNKVEDGSSGELFLGGNLLAREYLNLPETTAKSFLADAFDKTPEARMYRTGDLARMLPSGLMEITGRVGAMIKVRGYSVQPGAVESIIMRQLAVRHCAVISYGEGLRRQLVAYFVRDKEEPGDRVIPVVEESGYSPVARKTLSAYLAHYMIPALWVELSELPTHQVSGKVDLKRLPGPTGTKSPNGNGQQTEKDREIKIEAITKAWATSLSLPMNVITQEHDFFDLGGHSLALADLARRLTDNFGFPVPLARLAGNPTLEGHLEVVRNARDGHTAKVQADLPAVLRADSALPQDIIPTNTSMCSLKDAKTILLTGVNLRAYPLSGAFYPAGTIYLSFCRNGANSQESFSFGIWEPSILDRIDVVPGNLGRKRLGLSEEDFEGLTSNLDVIVHSGATVNLVYPYAAMRGANVGGTKEILRLAGRSGATVHYISTNGVLPPSSEGWSEDTVIDADSVPEKLVDGYGQTKWVAEQLVLEAGQRGLPVRIYRPGTISGHSVLGSTNTYDLLTALFVESIHVGYAPEIPAWLAEMTPVDFVTQAVVTLANHVDTDQRIFHIGDPKPVTATALLGDLTQLGYPTDLLGWDEWLALWNEKRGAPGTSGDDSFTAGILRRGMPTVDFLEAVTVLNDSKTQEVLDIYGLQRPKIDCALLEIYCRDWYARGWLSHAPRQGDASIQAKPKGPLAGRVAVVTGASSGIGAAVATALAREGAHVAIAARRTEALETLKTKLTGVGSKVLVHKTDVTNKAQVESLMRTATEELGPIDILVSCAGVMYFTMMKNIQTEEWDRTVDVNCKGLLHCLSSTVPEMLSRGKGHIVAISSDAGRKVFPGLGVYSASKFFVEATLQSLRLETAGTGLRVTSIQPGNVATDLLGMSTDTEALKQFGEPSGAKVLEPENVANAIVFALKQPEHVSVNEVLIEPRDEPI